MSERTKNVLLIEPYLEGYGGHFYNFLSELASALKEKKYNVSVCVPKIFSAASMQHDIAVYPLIPPRRSIQLKSKGWFSSYLNRLLLLIENIMEFFSSLMWLKKVLKQSDPELLIQTTTTFTDLLPWLFLKPKGLPKFFIFHSADLNVKRIKIVLWLLRLFPLRECKICAFQEELLQKFRQAGFARDNLIYFPVLIPIRQMEEFLKRNYIKVESDLFTFVYAGDAREEKGFHLLPEIVSPFLEKSYFVIQCNPSLDRKYTPLIEQSIKKLRDFNHPNLILLPRALEQEQYFSLLWRSDAVLIPYDSNSYAKSRASGILLEALFLGKPVIVPNNTSMSDLVKKFKAGAIFESGDADSLRMAMDEIFLNHKKYAENALGAREFIKANYGGTKAVEVIEEAMKRLYTNCHF